VALITASSGQLRIPAPSLAWSMAAGLCFTADLALWHTALHHTSAANATLLVGLAPLWVSLVSAALMGAPLRTGGWVGLGLGLAGAATLGLAAGAQLHGGLGELLGFLASFGYAGYTLCFARARRHGSSAQVLLGAVATSALAFGLLAMARGDAFSGFEPRAWAALVAVGLLVQVVAWWLIGWGLGHVPASLGSQGLLLQQVSTIFLGWLLLHEVPGLAQLLGIVLILGGIALAALFPPVPKARG
jgi:drug/metabolite transporter (DMT)-like permease